MTIKTIKELQPSEGSEKIRLIGRADTQAGAQAIAEKAIHPGGIYVAVKGGEPRAEDRDEALRIARVEAPLLREQAAQNLATLREINRANGRKRSAR